VLALRQLDLVDESRIVVLGHSLGGTAIPRIARRDPAIAAFVVMAGATRPLEDVLLGQLRYVAALDGVVTPREATVLGELAAEVERVKALGPSSALGPSELLLGRRASYWLDLRAKPAALLLHDERRPFLVLHGGRDFQVTTEDLAGWRRALAGNPRAQFVVLPELNHLFMTGAGPSTPDEYRRPGEVAPELVADIAAWIGRL
jgi:pimeloyl-ACP methyl ester carboxylesterase